MSPVLTIILSHIRSNIQFYSLFLLFLIAEFLVNPLGEFPLIDDWSFAQTVKIFSDTWKLDFGNYPAMTLFSQIVWGTLFSKWFGFSCLTLRLSTLVSLWISLFLFYRLLVQFGTRREVAALVTSVLLFNPMVFLLSNTFMTDVNFNTLLILCIFLLYQFFQTSRLVYYVLFVLSCWALLLLRQYGIIVPIAYLAASLLHEKQKAKHLLLATVNLVLVVVVLKLYESYLKHVLPQGSEYKFSGQVHVMELSFWAKLFAVFKARIGEILIQTLVMSSPVFTLILVPLLRQLKWQAIGSAILFSALLTWLLFFVQAETSNCIFSNTIIGPETFYENFNGARHNVGNAFEPLYGYIKILLSFTGLFSLTLLLFHLKNTRSFRLRPFNVFLACLLVCYVGMILITESYFDRYHIPLLTITALWIMFSNRQLPRGVVLFSLPVVLFFAYVSIAGTKDYFEWNRKRWEAYWHLRLEKQIEAKKINGGLEVNCWREGHGTGWGDFLNIKDFDYLIQFDEEPEFKLYKSYAFRRYFPYKIDKINIFVRDSLTKDYD